MVKTFGLSTNTPFENYGKIVGFFKNKKLNYCITIHCITFEIIDNIAGNFKSNVRRGVFAL